jgi:uncharacterized RDD family membrane protein YckC
MGTYGKSWMGLIVTEEDGGQLSFGHATGRYFAKILSFLTFGVGFLMVAFTPQKQALHDYICRTYVCKKKYG